MRLRLLTAWPARPRAVRLEASRLRQQSEALRGALCRHPDTFAQCPPRANIARYISASRGLSHRSPRSRVVGGPRGYLRKGWASLRSGIGSRPPGRPAPSRPPWWACWRAWQHPFRSKALATKGDGERYGRPTGCRTNRGRWAKLIVAAPGANPPSAPAQVNNGEFVRTVRTNAAKFSPGGVAGLRRPIQSCSPVPSRQRPLSSTLAKEPVVSRVCATPSPASIS